MKRTAMLLLFVAACARQGGLEIVDDDGLRGSSPSGGGGVGGTASGGSSSGNTTSAGTSSMAGGAGAPSGGSSGATSGGNGGAASGGNGGAASGGTGSSGASASGGKAGSTSAGTGGNGAGGGGAGGGGAGGNGPITQTDITGQFKTEETNTSSAVPAIHGELRVVNNDGGNAALTFLKVRYYFTNEGTMPLFQVRWGQLQAPGEGAMNLPFTGTVVSMPNPTSTADSYIEFLYSGDGVLDAGKTAVASFRLYDSTNQPVYRQDNDYSFSATPVASDKVVVFYKDAVIWGVEPQ